MNPLDDEPVGRVLGTDDATPLEFWTAVAPGQTVQLGWTEHASVLHAGPPA